MFNIDLWKEILETIQKNKLRTFLTGFTVALGILIFVSLFGLGNGLKNTFQKLFVDDATNTFYIFPGRTTLPYKGYKSNREIVFRNGDVADIKRDFALFLAYTTPRIERNLLVVYRQESGNYNVRAVGPSHMLAEKTIVMKGRYINTHDVQEKAKYAVIGRLVAQDLFKGVDGLGKYINIDGSTFKVIGVFQDDGGDNEERQIYIPYTTRQLIEKNTDKIDQIIIAFKPEIGYAGAMAFEKSLDTYIRNKKVISSKDSKGIFIRNVADKLKKNQSFASILQLIISCIALAVIISGVIGISNIMLYVVKERTKEIGIRKALGATPKNIKSSILLESIFITTIFGFIGMIVGITLLNSVGNTMEENYFISNPYVDIWVAIFATVLLIVCGSIAGYIPARRAARIKPIVALRDE